MSLDRGVSFTDETLLASNVNNPTIHGFADSSIIRGWNNSNNQILLQYKPEASTTFSSISPLVSGSPISSISGFHIFKAADSQNRIWLTCIGTGSTIKTFFSTDLCSSFQQYGSSYTNLSSAYEIRMAISQSNMKIRMWQNQNGSLSAQFRDIKDSDWGTMYSPTDGTSSLVAAASGWGHLEWAFDNQRRLSLTMVVSGEGIVSDYFSLDNGKTFQRLT